MKLSLITFIFLLSDGSFSQCKITIEEIVKFESMSNSQIETYTLEKGMSKFDDDAYICDDNMDLLMLDNGDNESVSSYSYITSDKTFYLDFKKHVDDVTDLDREEESGGLTYYTYLYEKYEFGICEVMFNSGINESGIWQGTIHIMFMH